MSLVAPQLPCIETTQAGGSMTCEVFYDDPNWSSNLPGEC